jgi:2-polyprenyl-3-methyl-5-hydroxy-6-metoxy-1,4-benzoquinol methylase
LHQIPESVKPGAVVGDFGCLDGSVAFNIADYCKHVYAYDLPEVIGKCKYSANNITYHGIDLDKVFPSLINGHYDLIIAMDVIEHLQYDISFLVACVQNMYIGSKIIISVPISEDGTVNQDPARRTHFREYREMEFRVLLDDAGIYIIDIHKQDDMIYIVGGKR